MKSRVSEHSVQLHIDTILELKWNVFVRKKKAKEYNMAMHFFRVVGELSNLLETFHLGKSKWVRSGEDRTNSEEKMD